MAFYGVYSSLHTDIKMDLRERYSVPKIRFAEKIIKYPERQSLPTHLITDRLNAHGLTLHVCDCSFHYGDLLFHIFGHHCPEKTETEHEVRARFIRYINRNWNEVDELAAPFLGKKTETLQEYVDHMALTGSRGDELAIYLLAQIYGLHVAVICKKDIFYTHSIPAAEADPRDCDIQLVFMGQCVFRDTKKVKKSKIVMDYKPGPVVPTKKPTKKRSLSAIPEDNEDLDPNYDPAQSADEDAPATTTKHGHFLRKKPRYSGYAPETRRRSRSRSAQEKSDQENSLADQDSGKGQSAPEPNSETADPESNVQQSAPDLKSDPEIIGQVEIEIKTEPDSAQEVRPTKAKRKRKRSRTRVVKGKTIGIRKRRRRSVKKCQLCLKTFPTQKELNDHTKTDHADHQFVCPIDGCGKKYGSQLALDKHKKSHDGTHKCDACEKTFGYPSELRDHKATHTDDKPYKCAWDKCKHAYKTKAEYRRHYKTHMAEKGTYKCVFKPEEGEGCTKTFDTKKGLDEHQKAHSDDLTYKCNLCDSAFKWRSGLSDHKRDDHNESDQSDKESDNQDKPES